MSRRDVQRLDCKRRHEAHCALRQHDENARPIKENEFLKDFIDEYKYLAHIQGAMRRRLEDICVQEAAESRKKRIYYAVSRIEAENNRRAYAGLVDYKDRIEHVRFGVQVQYEELRSRDGEEETCPNCGVKRIRVRT